MSFGSSKSKSSSNTKTTQDPWKPTIDYLSDYIRLSGNQGGIGLSPDQQASMSALKGNAAGGNPFTPQIGQLANDALNYSAGTQATDQANQGLSDLQSQLGSYASGQNLDPMSNPYLQGMLTQVADDAQNRINAMFAGAGRDLSGANQMAVGRGVTQAQLPLLLQQFNRGQDQQFDAAKTLYGATRDTAAFGSDQRANELATRGQGIGLAQAALDARDWGAQRLFDLDQAIKSVPYEDIAQLLAIMQPVAGLGGQGTSNTNSKSSSSGFGISLSDEREKTDIEMIGKMADGTPMYRFRYKDDPSGTVHVGGMAQEIEKKNPGAVTEGEGGKKYVDYDAATKRAVQILRDRMAKKKGA